MKNKHFSFSDAYIGIILILMYIPILLVIIYSFNESKISSVWGGLSLNWYKVLFNNTDLFKALFFSIILAFASSIIAAVIGTLGAVGIMNTDYKLNSVIEYIATLPIMIPEIILGMVFLVFFNFLKLPFGMTTLITAHTSFCIPYVFMQVKARLSGMDKSLTEAAMDLGANSIRAFLDITLPLLSPAVLSGMILSFAMSFDDVIISVFVTGVNTSTLPIKIYTKLKTTVTPEINALCTLMFIASLALGLLSAYIGKSKKY